MSLISSEDEKYSILDLGFSKDLSKTGELINLLNLTTPEMQNVISEGTAPKSLIDGELLSTLEQQTGVLFNGKTAFNNSETGYRLGIDSGVVKFYLGGSTNYLNWDGSTLTISGALSASSGTIGGFTISSTTFAATNLSIVSGVANTAHIAVGTGANLGGLNSANAGTDIVFWAGATHANRATAPFRVNAAGDLVATSVTNLSGILSAAANTGTVAKSADTSREITNGSYTKIKEFLIKVAGNYDVVFTINNADNSFTTYGQVYKNGVAAGTESSSGTSSDVTLNETHSSLVNGDLIQIYGKTTKVGSPWGIVKNFRLRAALVPEATVNTD